MRTKIKSALVVALILAASVLRGAESKPDFVVSYQTPEVGSPVTVAVFGSSVTVSAVLSHFFRITEGEEILMQLDGVLLSEPGAEAKLKKTLSAARFKELQDFLAARNDFLKTLAPCSGAMNSLQKAIDNPWTEEPERKKAKAILEAKMTKCRTKKTDLVKSFKTIGSDADLKRLGVIVTEEASE